MASLEECLKRYESNNTDEEKKKRKKPRNDAAGVVIVDDDPVWQKTITIDEPEENTSFDSPAQLHLSPPRQRRRRHDSDDDLSPPSQNRRRSPDPDQKNAENLNGSDSSSDLSPPRKRTVPDKTGLVTGKEIKEEVSWKKQQELADLKLLNASGVGAETVYRDKLTGTRISKDEYFKSQRKKEEKPKKEEKELEWGKGLAQKREAEAKLQDMELEKDKPFARFRDDPDLDGSLKDATRWGDPMAHLVKRKQQAGAVLPDLGDDEKMRESGFIIPQEIPINSWIKRGMKPPANRYGIKPGRHWDGVDRSNGGAFQADEQ